MWHSSSLLVISSRRKYVDVYIWNKLNLHQLITIIGYTIVDFILQFRLRLVFSASMSKSPSYIYSNVRVVTNVDDTVRSTFCVSVTHFKINDVLLYMHLFA